VFVFGAVVFFIVGIWTGTRAIEDHEAHDLAEKLLGYAPSYAWTFEQMGQNRVNEHTNPEDPLYLSLISYQRGWQTINPIISDIYTMKKAENGEIVLVVDAETDYDHNGIFEGDREARTRIGEVYEKSLPELESAFAGQASFTYEPYSDRWGRWVSAFVPMRDRQGNVDGVLGVDFPADEYLFDLRRARLLVELCSVFFFVAVFALFLAKYRQEQYGRFLKEALARAEKATAIKSDFLANMSHEIRTPLNGILGMINLISDQPISAEVRKQIEIMKNCGTNLMALINDILDFSKIEAQKLVLEETAFQVNETIEGVLDLLRPGAKEKGLTIILSGHETSHLWIRSDLSRFRQVIINLVSNAVKFTPEGSVTIQALILEKNNDQIKFQFNVVDTGIGMNEEAQKRLFQSFSQVDASTTRRFGGTGLGLAICKGIVEAMGGSIWVESHPGQGTKFSFTLFAPVASAPVAEACSVDISVDPKMAQKKPLRILVADDHSTNRLLALKFLEKLGYNADSVANGLEVLDLVNTRPFDVIFMDCQMPEMDGYVTTQKLHQRFSKNTRPWIIALTASAFATEKERCMKVGMDDFVSKPFNPESLAAALHRVKVASSKDTVSSFDHSAMQRQFRGEQDVLMELIADYLASAAGLKNEVQKAIESKDPEALRVASHKLRGTIGNFFAHQIQEDLLKLELMGKNKDIVNAPGVFLKIQDDLKELDAELKKFSSRKVA